MEKLTIDEVIEHCKKKVERFEEMTGKEFLESQDLNDNLIKEYWEHRQVAEWLEELKRYKDLAGQGRILILPCGVGDTIYKIWRGPNSTVRSIKHEGHIYKREIPDYFVMENVFELKLICEFGKTVFLTREEAEQALKEIEER